MPFLTISLTYIIHSNDSHLSYLSPSPVKSYHEDRGRGMTPNQISLELREGSLSVEVVTGRCQVDIMGKHDPNKPQIKMSLYNFFMYTCCDEYKKRHHDMWDNIGEFSKNKRWKTLSAKEKQNFKVWPREKHLVVTWKWRTMFFPKEIRLKKVWGRSNWSGKTPVCLFLFFSNNNQRSKVNKHSGLSIGDTVKKLGEMWP